MTDRTNSDRVADGNRKRAKRKQQTGRAGRASKELITKQNEIMGGYKDLPLDFFTENEAPELSDPQRRLLCLMCDPDVIEHLNNKQMGKLVGLSGREVGGVRTNRKFMEAIDRLHKPMLQTMTPDVLKSLHKAIREGDNTARSQWFKMMGWIRDGMQTTVTISDSEVSVYVHDSLASLMPKPGDTVESDMIDADFSVEDAVEDSEPRREPRSVESDGAV